MIDQADKLRQVIDNLKIKQAENRAAMTINMDKKSARVITVTSGKGGVGKTNVAVNLAITLGELGQRVIILDADFGLANIDVVMGIVPQCTLVDFIRCEKSVFQVLTEGPKNVRFLSGGSGVEELVKLNESQRQQFVENIALLDKIADIIIIDTGAGLSDNVMSFVMAADEVLLVATPEPTSITDAYALIKMISNRDIKKRIKIIVNRAESVSEANDIMNKLVMVADKFLNLKLEPVGYIMYDDAVIKSVKQQKPFSLCYPRSQAAKNVRDISNKMVQAGNETKFFENAGFKGFINKLVGLMKT